MRHGSDPPNRLRILKTIGSTDMKLEEDSGSGSYNKFAQFKAEILNAFVHEKNISSVIEYGCGDGNQLSLMAYPNYIGFDISQNAISRCADRFANDSSKSFKLVQDYDGEIAELTISLDVIYHLVEDDVFIDHIKRLFDSSEKYVVIYSSDTNENPEGEITHVRHRKFSDWVSKNKPEWELVETIGNKYPSGGGNDGGSAADFYIYAKSA